MTLDLPPKFVEKIQNTFGVKGKRWVEAFPAILDEACQRWGLTDIQPVPNLSYNFVAFAQLIPESNVSRRWLQSQPAPADDAGGQSIRPSTTGFGELIPPLRTETILKLGVPNRELTSEIAALRYYNGHGACCLLDADAEKGMLLLERLQPGHMLSTVADDEYATRIAAEVMRQLWQSSSDFSHDQTNSPVLAGGAGEVVSTNFIQLKDWFDGFERLRKRYKRETGPLPQHLVETAASLSREFLIENKDETLLHGDFHHFNVLKSARGWLAIDPKGVIGPRGYELGPFLINPVPDLLKGDKPRVQMERRISILAEMLGMERERIRSWAICHAVLSAWWSIEDNDPNQGKYSLRCAEIFMQI